MSKTIELNIPDTAEKRARASMSHWTVEAMRAKCEEIARDYAEDGDVAALDIANDIAALKDADAVEAMRAQCEAIARSLIGFSAGRVADAIVALKDKP